MIKYLIIISSLLTLSQSITIDSIDATQWPEIEAHLSIVNVNGESLSLDQVNDFNILDGDVKSAEIINTKCIESNNGYSFIFLVDFSQSMQFPMNHNGPSQSQFFEKYPNRRIDKIQSSLQKLIIRDELIDLDRSEVSIISFSSRTKLDVPFTQNKNDQSLNNFLTKQIGISELGSTTKYNSAFTGWDMPNENDNLGTNFSGYPFAGIPYAINEAKYKPVIIFMTDGEPADINISYELLSNKLIDNEITLFSILVGSVSVPGLYDMSYSSSGDIYESILSESELDQSLNDIINNVNELEVEILKKCSATWISDCSGGLGRIDATVDGSVASSDFDYSDQIFDILPELIVDKTLLEFGNQNSFKLFSDNNNSIIQEIRTNSNSFSIDGVEVGDTIYTGNPRDITLIYTGNEFKLEDTLFVNSSACNDQLQIPLLVDLPNNIEFSSDNFQILPNPNTGIFTVQIPLVSERIDIRILDLLGNEVHKSTIEDPNKNKREFHLELIPGAYLLVFENDLEKVSKKLIIK